MYALVTEQGTAAAETGLCEHCFDDDNKAYVMATAPMGDYALEAGFVDVTGNDAIYCIMCEIDASLCQAVTAEEIKACKCPECRSACHG